VDSAMIVAYNLSAHDDGTYMLGNETYRPPRSAGFHDWRFGKDGVPHPATCPTCGRKTDPDYVNPKFRAKRRTWDISATYDGYKIVSERFREFCLKHGWEGMTFVPLPSDTDFFVLRLSNILPFDTKRSGTRFEDPCPTCSAFYNVIGATPYLRDVTEPIQEGFFRSNLEFASGHEQHPLILVGIGTAEKLLEQKFQKFNLEEVEALLAGANKALHLTGWRPAHNRASFLSPRITSAG
jgi:hypothetical protein